MQKRKTVLGIILVAIMLSAFLLIRPAAAEEKGYRDISVQQARRMINHNSRNLLILDVRNQSEYDLGHLYDAILLPVFLLENGTIQIQDHINDKIIVYCKAGSRSAEACQILVEKGFSKIYNMVGGITAWMEADYPIYTSYHHVTVNFANHGKKTIINIEPWLLYQDSCTSCQSQTQSSSSTPQVNVTKTVLEDSENHTIRLIAEEVNGTTSEYVVDKTLLWRYTELESEFNRTITFTSIIYTRDNKSIQVFRLYDNVQHKDYNLTLFTILSPLDSVTYNTSVTVMNYAPSGKTEIISLEWADFNKPLTLSQLYAALGKVADELGNDYKKSEDENLTPFAQRYYMMANEAKLLSNTVKIQLLEYNKNILKNTAIIMDDVWTCILCAAVFYIAIGGTCALACGCTAGVGCVICLQILGLEQYWTYGVTYVCEELIGCMGESQPSYNYVSYTTEYEYYASVNNHEYLRGNPIDGNYAQIYVANPPGMGQIIGTMNGQYVHGSIQIYGKSVSGYYSDLYVYVSLDGQNWNFVDFKRITSTSPYWIDFGYVSDCFNYIAIVGYDSGFSVNLYLDAVRVIP